MNSRPSHFKKCGKCRKGAYHYPAVITNQSTIMITVTVQSNQASFLGKYNAALKSAIVTQVDRSRKRRDTASLQLRATMLGDCPEVLAVRYRL